MVYRVIGLMSGSSLDGLDIAFVEFTENAGKWSYEIKEAECYPYAGNWQERLRKATVLDSMKYQLLHAEYGRYIGGQVNQFINEYGLQYQVALVASHGHTTFHLPGKKMTAQLGDGAAIAAETGLPVVTDLRALDVALGGQGAPIVPIGEKLLLGDYDFFLNLGGIANISFNDAGKFIAFDICPANRVLNMLVSEAGKEFDEGGQIAAEGKINDILFERLNALDYYTRPFPKSLGNEFGTDTVYPMVKSADCSISDALRTYVEHIVVQIEYAVVSQSAVVSRQSAVGSRQSAVETAPETGTKNQEPKTQNSKLLATGGGVFNTYLVERLTELLNDINVELVIPDEKLVSYKEALIIALIGVLRWRQEYNVLSSVTGASRDSIGGALWNGQEA